ncbi:hypothetical protein GTW36_04580 [Vibrio parahaemolyticus]|uniref:phage tail tip protein n=1 Tax=Vibrio parahaemolyticus TaxID=670 RepID=UPI0004017EDA|nr:hypothetical protein [Vibrio parahaemolyticus]EGQ8396132.1 hypothetical protein [Vibrio parahaemolyticus]EGQ9584793.1 hypothetical protein [Vibrio parahaemolyticus]EGR2047248.1 hypothetical protein [Vibrio parahaemolyticus]EGR2386767.1 hypothetical protein [Vibrio parahaemolyticus]EGR2596111.1 hypothetical protein [Vibrio parahaemolyticus]
MAVRTLQGGKKLKGKFQSIPHKKGSDAVMDAVADNLEQLIGMRGEGGKKAVLWEDMKKLGFADYRNGKLQSTINIPSSDGGSGDPIVGEEVQTPTTPQNLVVKSGFGIALLSWDTAPYKGHAYTEIYQARDNVFANAIVVQTTPSSVASLPIEPTGDYYYWIKFVNLKGERSAINSINGTHAKSVVDPQYYLDLIIKEMEEHPELIPLPEALEGIDFSSIPDAETIENIDVLLAEAAMQNAVTVDKESAFRREENRTLRAEIETNYYTAVETDKAMAVLRESVTSQIEENETSILAQIKREYATKVEVDSALSALRESVKSEIQSNGESILAQVGQEFATQVELDKAISTAKLDLETQLGDSISGIEQNYATNAKLTSAISQLNTSLSASIEGVESNLSTNYKTWVDTEKAINIATNSLSSKIGEVESNLANNYYTEAQTDQAIAKSALTLQSSIDGVSSNLSKNYYTKTQTNQAISTEIGKVNATVNGVSSSVTQISEALADLDDGYSALWGVKTSIGGMTASVALIAKSSTDTSTANAEFVVKNAGFKVAYDKNTGGTGSNSIVPVFGTIKNPAYQDWVNGGQVGTAPPKYVLAIDTASIKVADIRDLVAGDVVATSVQANTVIANVTLRASTINDPNSNFYVSAAGVAKMVGADVSGKITATSGVLNNVTIADTCTINGRLYVNQIIGDVFTQITMEKQNVQQETVTRSNNGAAWKVGSFSVENAKIARELRIAPVGYSSAVGVGVAVYVEYQDKYGTLQRVTLLKDISSNAGKYTYIDLPESNLTGSTVFNVYMTGSVSGSTTSGTISFYKQTMEMSVYKKRAFVVE